MAEPRPPQRSRGRLRVAALMAAAAALFVEKGYEATTMTEIAGRAGASIGTLYLFFPTKQALAKVMLIEMAEILSLHLDALQVRTSGWRAAAIADALFEALSLFLAAHPAYAALIDLPTDGGWKPAVRARRRAQIAALFAQANPALPADQAERLAVIVPHLIRITIVLGAEPTRLRGPVQDELQAMLRHHLE
jgi:AcrR family transcriptional regulator